MYECVITYGFEGGFYEEVDVVFQSGLDGKVKHSKQSYLYTIRAAAEEKRWARVLELFRMVGDEESMTPPEDLLQCLSRACEELEKEHALTVGRNK